MILYFKFCIFGSLLLRKSKWHKSAVWQKHSLNLVIPIPNKEENEIKFLFYFLFILFQWIILECLEKEGLLKNVIVWSIPKHSKISNWNKNDIKFIFTFLCGLRDQKIFEAPKRSGKIKNLFHFPPYLGLEWPG